MNRKKRINQILKAKLKKANAKKNNKPKYISKADRAKMEQEQAATVEDSAVDVQAEEK